MKSLLLLSLAGAAFGSALTKPEAVASKPDDTVGSISGKVVFEGDRPEPLPALTIGEKEAKGCHHGGEEMDTADHSLLIDDKGGVANVVLTIEAEGFERDVPTDPIPFDQHGCRFDPHVIVIPVGATLRFDNSDETNHNIHTFAKKNQPVNKNVAGGTSFDQVVDKAEVIDVKCDIHPWMKGYIVVTDATHWAVSGKDGSFTIEGLPPGDYKVSYWHEQLGKGKTESVTVTAGAMADLEVKLGEKKEKGGRRRR